MLAKDIFRHTGLHLKDLNSALMLYGSLKDRVVERFFKVKIYYSFTTESNNFTEIELEIEIEDEINNLKDLIRLFKFINNDENRNENSRWIGKIIEFYTEEKNLFRSNDTAKLLHIALKNTDIIKIEFYIKELDLTVTTLVIDNGIDKKATMDLEEQIMSLTY